MGEATAWVPPPGSATAVHIFYWYAALPLSMKTNEFRTPCAANLGVHQPTSGVIGLQAVEIMESSSKSLLG